MDEHNYIFDRPIVDIIKERISVRSYEKRPLDKSTRKSFEDYISKLKGPFDARIRFKLIDNESSLNTNVKLGTYGVIRGASTFVAAAVHRDDMYLEELGYRLEKFILYAASMGIGTCWMGGTFKKSEFAKAMNVAEEELLPVITPLGYPSDNKSLLDSLMRRLAGSKNRKDFEEIFFDGSFHKKLTMENSGIYKYPLEMVRLAPSASNKQPWRVVKDGDKLHFYLLHNKGYSSALGFDMQKIDIGIAMCHLELTLMELIRPGRWVKEEPKIQKPSEDMEYIISWMK